MSLAAEYGCTMDILAVSDQAPCILEDLDLFDKHPEPKRTQHSMSSMRLKTHDCT